jgi:hypothetical protein
MDYKNLIGKGHSALYLTTPKHNFYLMVSDSFTKWLKQNNEYKAKNYFQVNENGSISTWLNLNEIYR